jgi:hypothetical protein
MTVDTTKLMVIENHIPRTPKLVCDSKPASGILIKQSEIAEMTIVVIVLPAPLMIPLLT